MNDTKREAPVISTGDWLLTLFLSAIPIVNFILLLVWAFGGGANPNKANWAKAALLFLVLGILLYIFVFAALVSAFMDAVSTATISL